MATLLQHNVAGREVRAPVPLGRGRRRLSTIVARHADRSRPHIVCVQRVDQPPLHVEEAVVRRRDWAKTSIGPKHVVLVIYLPMGNGGGAGKQIAGALAMAALLFVAPYAAALVPGAGPVGSLTWIGKAVAAGIVVGGSFLIGLATRAKANKGDQLYGVSGGGNLPRPGDRIPVGYGQFWTQPDLSQPDFTAYDGEDVLLYGRRTMGLGKYLIEEIQVGDVTLWTAAEGIRPPFAQSAGSGAVAVVPASGQGSGVGCAVEIINPGGTSALVPESVYSAPSVGGAELARTGDNPAWTGPFPVCPVGKTTALIQLDFSIPSGYYRTTSSGMKQWGWSGIWQYAPCDADNNATGPWQTLHQETESGKTTKPKRYTRFKTVPAGRYIVRAQNQQAKDDDHVDSITWDGLRAHFQDTIVRPGITEIAFRIRSGKAIGNAAFNNLWVKATRILPVWNGSAWVEQPTRKAVYAFKDILQADYGGNLPDSGADLERVKHYATTVTQFDTFDGVIRGPVSVRDAAATVLGVMRAEPVRLGRVWSMQRDEPRTIRKHVISARQIARGSTKMSVQVARDQGEADVIVEYSPNGDPRKRAEVRRTFGTQSLTPARRSMIGVSGYEHANHLATWMGAAAYHRRERRSGLVDRRGRIIQRGDPILMDVFFTGDATAAGLLSRAGNTLVVDTEVPIVGTKYATLKDRRGRAFGPILVTQGANPTTLLLNAADLAAAQTAAGLTLDQVVNEDRAEQTTVLVSDLVVQTDAFQVESVAYQGMDRVEITALEDSPAVWEALGEAAPPAPPIPSVVAPDQPPNLLWVNGRAVQKTNSLDLEWSVGVAPTAVQNIVRISYDEGANWETVSDTADASGSYPIEHVAVPIRIQAYAVDAQGRPGPVVENTVATFQPVVPVEATAPEILTALQVDIPNAIERLRKPVFGEFVPPTLGALPDNLKTAKDAALDVYNALAQRSAEDVLADRRLRRDISSSEQRSRAFIETVQTTLQEADEALAEQVTTALSEINDLDADLSGLSTSVTSLSTRTTTLEGQMTTVSSSVVSLDSRITAAEGVNSGQAAALTALDTRVTATEGVNTSQASSITALDSRMTAAEGVNTSQASALSSLDTRVTAAEGVNSTQATAITSLEGRMTSAEGVNTSQATALSGLDTRLTAAEGVNTSQATALTNLTTRITNAEGVNTAQGTALTSLDTRVTAAEGVNTSQGAALTSLDGRVTTAEGTLSSQGSAISGLTTRMTAAEGVNTSQASAITALDTRLTTAEGVNASQATAISGLDSRVTAAEGVNTSQASALTSLDSRITAAEGVNSSQATALSGLDTRVTATETVNSSQATALTSLDSRMTTAEGTNAAQATALTGLQTTTTETSGRLEALVATERMLDAAIGPIRAQVEDLANALATSTGSEVIQARRIKAEMVTREARVQANIDEVESVSVAADTALAATQTALDTRITAAEGVNSSQATALSGLTTRVTDVENVNTSQAGALTSLDSRMTSAEGVNSGQATALTSLGTRMTSAEGVNTSQASALTSLDSRMTSAEGVNTAQASTLTSYGTRITTAEGNITANASSISSLSATVSGHTASISSLSSVQATQTGQLSTAYVLRADGGGAFKLQAVTGGGYSYFDLYADQIRFHSSDGMLTPFEITTIGGNKRITFRAPVYFAAEAYITTGGVTTSLLANNSVTNSISVADENIGASAGTSDFSTVKTINITTTGGRVYIGFYLSGSAYAINVLATLRARIKVDGTVVGPLLLVRPTRGFGQPGSEGTESTNMQIQHNLEYRSDSLAAGAHTVTLEVWDYLNNFATNGLTISGEVTETKR